MQDRMRYDLNALLEMPPDHLRELYVGASTPRIENVQGPLRGRMLAWQDVHGAGAKILRTLASTSQFPWRGKSFFPNGTSSGEGVNRVFADRFTLFRFVTSIGKSRAGDFD